MSKIEKKKVNEIIWKTIYKEKKNKIFKRKKCIDYYNEEWTIGWLKL